MGLIITQDFTKKMTDFGLFFVSILSIGMLSIKQTNKLSIGMLVNKQGLRFSTRKSAGLCDAQICSA